MVFGTLTARARFRTCASHAVNVMGLAVGHMFVKEAFDEEAKDLVILLLLLLVVVVVVVAT